MKTLTMRLAFYKSYFMLNLIRKKLNDTANFVCRFHRFLWQVSKYNKIDCEMNAQQSSYLPSVHHVMSHVTRDNCPSNKKAASSVQTYNQLSHVTSAKKKIRKE